jgi:cysteinyl-tRNA synthetase
MSAIYRAKLNFTWESLEGAATALNRLRRLAYEWGEPSTPDPATLADFTAQINDDLNMPRALAVVWELTRADLPAAVKKATLLECDRVLGLGLAAWQPPVEDIPAAILALVEQRQTARAEKRWADADALRQAVTDAGYEIEDTPSGARVKSRPPHLAN